MVFVRGWVVSSCYYMSGCSSLTSGICKTECRGYVPRVKRRNRPPLRYMMNQVWWPLGAIRIAKFGGLVSKKSIWPVSGGLRVVTHLVVQVV